MTIEQNERIAFLKKSHLFRSLTDEEIGEVAGCLKEESHPAGEAILKEGDTGDLFYLIFTGQVRVTQRSRGGEKQLAVFVEGDYFGETGAGKRRPRNATVSALEETTLLTLTGEDFSKFVKRFPKFKSNIHIAVSSRRLARMLQFKWLASDEVIYFLARKHVVFLWRALLWPILALIIPAILFWWGRTNNEATLLWMGVGALALIFIPIIWIRIDWGNDFYIVTNKRAIWLEKVIGLYESRQEAPLENIVFVGVKTNAFGRIFDYGAVNVRTFIGRIVFHRVQHPADAEALINELRERKRSVSRRTEIEAMKNSLRSRLGLPTQGPVQPVKPPEIKIPSPYRPSLWQILSSRFFALRSEYRDTITYHKHWFIWLRQTIKPWLGFFGLIAMIIYTTFVLSPPETPLTLLTLEVDTILGILLIADILWLIYEWVDWSNDMFQVTPDNILDIDKKPLGKEERKSAPLESILSTSYERLGILGLIFNYGTVYITVGGAQMEFEDVHAPAAVQQDIDDRRSARMFKKKAAEIAAERERMADWFAVYHETAERTRREAGPQEPGGSGVQ
jgi:CRP-like cAMP-binding protein